VKREAERMPCEGNAKIGIMTLQTKEHQGLPATTRSQKETKNNSFLQPQKGAQICQYLDSGIVVYRN
jgi:hypothetical protein